jgi:hypothetical protein
MPYRVTKESRFGGMSVRTESEFNKAVCRLFKERKPKQIIETGTYLGLGTTEIICRAIREAKLEDTEFHTIECNPMSYQVAKSNLQGYPVICHHGLSVPRNCLPSREEIEAELVTKIPEKELWVDGYGYERVNAYHQETDFAVQDDLLGKLLGDWGNQADFILLDSAGHMGFREFTYVIDRLTSPCVIWLDDVHHVKHNNSLNLAKSDPKRFRVLVESDEKFGFASLLFNPLP